MDPIQPQSPLQSPVQMTPQLPQEPNKNHRPLIVVVVITVFAIVGVLYWYLNYYAKPAKTIVESNKTLPTQPAVENSENSTTPEIEASINSKGKAWSAIQALVTATSNNDNFTFNELLAIPKPECNTSPADCPYMEPIKQVLNSIQKEDIKDIWEDDKQLIVHTVKQSDSGQQITLAVTSVIFTKKLDGTLDFLGIRPDLTAGTTLQNLQDKLKDSDQDGLIDSQEICNGDFATTSCKKSDPNKRDTDSNGYWDSTDYYWTTQTQSK